MTSVKPAVLPGSGLFCYVVDRAYRVRAALKSPEELGFHSGEVDPTGVKGLSVGVRGGSMFESMGVEESNF